MYPRLRISGLEKTLDTDLFPGYSLLRNVSKPLIEVQHLGLELAAVDAFTLVQGLEYVLEHLVLALQHRLVVRHPREKGLQQE